MSALAAHFFLSFDGLLRSASIFFHSPFGYISGLAEASIANDATDASKNLVQKEAKSGDQSAWDEAEIQE